MMARGSWASSVKLVNFLKKKIEKMMSRRANKIFCCLAGDMYDKRLRKEFNKIDRDGGGFVDVSELSTYILKKYKEGV